MKYLLGTSRAYLRVFVLFILVAFSNQSTGADSNGFNYPLGDGSTLTPANDGDGFYNAQDFGVGNHLGEDWNGEGGGNSDLGVPVYAASNGVVSYSGFYSSAWGNIITIEHTLPTGEYGGTVETQYAHLNTRSVSNGDTVTKGQQIGTIGNSGTSATLAHLHFELRSDENIVAGGLGYSSNRTGWLDPSDFIDTHRNISADLPDLTIYQPSGWSHKVVMSTSTGCSFSSCSGESTFSAGENIYLSWAVKSLVAVDISETFHTSLYIDGVLKTTWSSSGLDSGFVANVKNYDIGSLSAGNHTIRIETDKNSVVSESNESNNSYSFDIGVTGGLPDLAIYQPSGWSHRVVTSTTTGCSFSSCSGGSTFSAGENIYLSWAVKSLVAVNISETFHTSLYIDGVLRVNWSSSGLDSGFVANVVNYDIGSLSPGNHTIRIETDKNSVVSESNESNNSYSFVIGVTGDLPDLAIYQPSGWSHKVVMSTTTGCSFSSCSGESTFSTDEDIYLSWAVKSLVDVDIPETFHTSLYIDGVLKNTWSSSGLDSGFVANVLNYDIGSLSAGNHTIRIETDKNSAVSESNEGNNSFSFVSTIDSGEGPRIGTGIGGLGDTKTHIDTYYDTTLINEYELKDVTRRQNMNVHGHAGEMISSGVIETHEEEFFGSGIMQDLNNNWNATSQSSGVDAHVYAAAVYDYFLSEFDLNSYDGAGNSMINLVESDSGSCNNSNNAFWSSVNRRVVYCEGVNQLPYSAAKDVVAHEWAHGVTAFATHRSTNNNAIPLVYEKQSGALNEAFSDWIAIAFEHFQGDENWLIAEDVNRIRSLSNPRIDLHPDTFEGDDWIDTENCTPAPGNDYCGVHTNSGVPNKMFYLLSEGGTHNSVVVTGIGIEEAMQIAFDANTMHWSAGEDFVGARAGMILAATPYGNSAEDAVRNAWAAVGVGQQANPPKTLTSLVVSGASSVDEGNSSQYTARAYFSDGTNSIVTAGASWSENSSATSISSNGLLSANAVSSDTNVTITASYVYGGTTRSDTKVVTVRDTTVPKTLTSVVVSGSSSVDEGNSSQYTARAYFSDGTNSIVTAGASWSENSSATSISSNGLLSASAVSSDTNVTITASYVYGGTTRSDTKVVTVRDTTVPKTLTSVVVSGSSSVDEGNSSQYTARAYFSDGTNSIVTAGASWSENSSATSISSNGLLSANAVGSDTNVTITASYYYGNLTKTGDKLVTIKNRISEAPTPIATDGGYNDKVNIRWGSLSGVDTVEVYRCANQTQVSCGSPIATVASSPYADYDAAPGVEYFYRLKICIGSICSGFGDYDTGYKGVTPPPTPIATDGGYDDKVNIRWGSLSGIDSVEVYRCANDAQGSCGSPIATVVSSPYADYDGASGVEYFYRLKSCIGIVCSSFTDYDTGYKGVTPPPTPIATDGGYDDKVNIRWGSLSGIDSVEVYRCANDAQGSCGSPIATVASSPYSDYDAARGVQYFYRLKSCIGSICSGFSDFDLGYKSIIPPPKPIATDGGYDDKVNIRWGSLTGIDSVEVYRCANDAQGSCNSPIAKVARSPYADYDAEPGIEYYYRLKGCIGSICSGFTDYDTGYKGVASPPKPIATDGGYDDKVNIRWGNLSGIDSIEVYRCLTAAQASCVTPIATVASSPYADFDAVPAVEYFYRVKSCIGSICSGFSEYDTGYKGVAPPPTPIATDGGYDDKVNIRWGSFSGGDNIEVYRCANEAQGSCGSPIATVTGSPFADYDAVSGVKYVYRLKACIGDVCSSFSESNSGFIRLMAPINLIANEGSYSDKVNIRWGMLSSAGNYKVYRCLDDSTASCELITNGIASSPYTDYSGLPGVHYFYRVRACINEECSSFSGSVLGYTKASVSLPATPLSRPEASDGSFEGIVRVAWDSQEGASEYSVYRCAAASVSSCETPINVAALSYDYPGGLMDQTYYFRIKACNEFGCSLGYSPSDTGYRSKPANLTIGEAVEAEDMAWEMNPNGSFYYQSLISFDGDDAAQSAVLGDNGDAILSLDEISATRVTFNWKVSSEKGFDEFKFFVDGVEVDAISGEQDWVEYSTTLSSGTHDLKWQYAKDESVSVGYDTAWLDNVRIELDNGDWCFPVVATGGKVLVICL